MKWDIRKLNFRNKFMMDTNKNMKIPLEFEQFQGDLLWGG
nr:MAG TPA: hypothetical protein [Caudoviricetes sp.]